MPDSAHAIETGPEAVVIWGTSGHAAAVVDVLNSDDRYRLAGLLDDVNTDRHGEERYGARVLGDAGVLSRLDHNTVRHVFVAIGDNDGRLKCAGQAVQAGFVLPTLVHPRAHLGSRVELADGTVLMALAVVNVDTIVGACSIVNTGAIVEHNCHLGEGVHVGPGAVVAGWAEVEDRVWIGAGAIVRDRIRIGEGSVVGAGSVVVKDVPPGVVVVGVPARIMRDIAS